MNKIYRILGEKGRITIPYEIRKYVGFKQNDILSFYVQDDRDILIKKEKLCGECTEEIKDKAVNDENITLREFLDSLMCLDSDEAGQSASQRIAEKLIEKGYEYDIEIPHGKDWNEELCVLKEAEDEDLKLAAQSF